MYYEEYSPEEQKSLEINQKRKNQRQRNMLITLLLVGGIVYYFFIYLKQKRNETKEEIEQLLRTNHLASVNSLDNKLWAEKDNWEVYLSSLYLLSQIEKFKENMKKAIKRRSEEIENEPNKLRQVKIDAAKDFLEEEEKELPDIKKALKNFIKKINQASIDDLSTPAQEFVDFVQEKRDKRKRLYWKLTAHNWADRWLARNRQSFNSIWGDLKRTNGDKEPSYFDAKGIYKISFPKSLWNEMNEEQRQLAMLNGHDELKLKDDVWTYEFSDLIKEWKRRVASNPVRGEYNPNQSNKLDNNALFYGAPRTGKSIMAEIVTYEANCYPLVVIQGSTLTPNKIQKDLGLDPMLKFFFTISSITYDLVEDYGFERSPDGEVRYILFIDEADQVCTTNSLPPKDVSTQLTFLKECMGSDNKKEESKNLWIAATNHLDSINIAVYQSGRLSNPLDYSWTLAIFNHYASNAGISHQFPRHWKEVKTLNAEDNKWVNKFNKIIFDKDFLPFWRKFIVNSDTLKDLNEEMEWKDGEKIVKKKGIQWGEFFEFFWQLYDSKQLENSNGRWEKPRKPTIEEVVEENVKLAANKISTDISKAVDTRLKELNDTAKSLQTSLNVANTKIYSAVNSAITNISGRLTEIGNKIKKEY